MPRLRIRQRGTARALALQKNGSIDISVGAVEIVRSSVRFSSKFDGHSEIARYHNNYDTP